jgi:hypothetical protein
LDGYETWSLTLRVFDRVRRRIQFGLKRNELIGGRRILHNEERHKLYLSLNIIRMMKSGRIDG